MHDVATPKRNKPGRPAKPNRSGTPINVRISVELREALNVFVDSQRPRADLTEHVELAIEEYLSKRGAWPLPD